MGPACWADEIIGVKPSREVRKAEERNARFFIGVVGAKVGAYLAGAVLG